MTGLATVAYLGWHEFRRLCRPGPLLLLLSPMVVFSLLSLRHPWWSDLHVLGSVTIVATSWLPQAIPLVAGLAGGSLAGDIRRGLTLTVLARGISRGQYLLARGLAAGLCSSLVALAGLGFFYLGAWVKLPGGNSTISAGPDYPGPVPPLFEQSPLGSDLLILAICMLAAAALSLVGLLAGSLLTNEYVAILAPMLLTLLGVFVLRHIVPWLSPYAYLHLRASYPVTIAASQRPYAAFVYWLALGACMAVLARWAFFRRELV